MNKEPLIPIDAHSLEVFAIKDSEESPTGKQAFIGFKLPNNDFHFIGVPYTEPASKEKLLYLKEKADNKKALIDAITETHTNRKQITKVIKDKPNLTERISAGLDRELQRQKKAGAKFISDEEIDTLIDSIIKEELGDAWKENYESPATKNEIFIKKEFPKNKPKEDGFYITDYAGDYNHSAEWVKGDCFINYSGGVIDKKITWFLEKI